MTCRSARLFLNPAPLNLVYCRMCGSTDLQLSCSSKTFGPHMCLICVQSLIELGTAKQSGPVPLRELVRT
ncbi:hypothetical protein PJI16_18935 [Nitrospira sp. MA-1]|nr:hypothetical protein [Nitrospira sp. MA-1]